MVTRKVPLLCLALFAPCADFPTAPSSNPPEGIIDAGYGLNSRIGGAVAPVQE